MLNSTQRLLDEMRSAFGPRAELTVLTICGGVDRLAEEMQKQPWSHMRTELAVPEGRA